MPFRSATSVMLAGITAPAVAASGEVTTGGVSGEPANGRPMRATAMHRKTVETATTAAMDRKAAEAACATPMGREAPETATAMSSKTAPTMSSKTAATTVPPAATVTATTSTRKC
jgi:hypothetical protein